MRLSGNQFHVHIDLVHITGIPPYHLAAGSFSRRNAPDNVYGPLSVLRVRQASLRNRLYSEFPNMNNLRKRMIITVHTRHLDGQVYTETRRQLVCYIVVGTL
jgi:hypothetical protein